MMKALAATTSSAVSRLGALLPGRPVEAPAAGDGPVDIKGLLRGPSRLGIATVVGFFVVLGGWAATAPLSSGAIAPGIVSPDSNRKLIQHLEGGIIRIVHVREGERVKAGDPLITLEATRAAASFSAREQQWLRLLVVRARLEAQQQDRDALRLPPEVVGLNDVALDDYIETQRAMLAGRQATARQEVAIHERKIEQLRSEIVSIEAESAGMLAQRELIEKELVDKQKLLAAQLIPQSSVLGLQREAARLDSAVASNTARIARAGQSIEETRLAILQAREKYLDGVAQESTSVNNELAQIDEDMVASGDVLRRTSITSPVDGIVLNFRNQTPGGVIRAGEPIMDVVPVDDDPIIIARLQPRDIDVVHTGLKAQVTLLPFASRNSLPLNGEVVHVAPDSTLDEATRQYHYEVRVRVSVEELAKHKGFYMSPGMPANVTVVTGERTMLQYLFDPFVRSIKSAFVYD
jgi:HlyD family type I secretion membrane fusion protein